MQNVKKSYNTSTKTYLKLFDSQIKPILVFGGEIWGLSTLPKKSVNSGNINFVWYESIFKNIIFNKVHIRFCKFVLQVSKHSKQIAFLAELGRFPIYKIS